MHHFFATAGSTTSPMAAKIVIIDDDEAVRNSMSALLDSYGYEVLAFGSAEDFLHQSNGSVDCLLVDHHMPGMTGLDLLEHLRAQGDRTPALMITGRSEPSMAPRAEKIGVKLMSKPVGEEALVLWIKSACGA